jgi:hypothetical protein
MVQVIPIRASAQTLFEDETLAAQAADIGQGIAVTSGHLRFGTNDPL